MSKLIDKLKEQAAKIFGPFSLEMANAIEVRYAINKLDFDEKSVKLSLAKSLEIKTKILGNSDPEVGITYALMSVAQGKFEGK